MLGFAMILIQRLLRIKKLAQLFQASFLSDQTTKIRSRHWKCHPNDLKYVICENGLTCHRCGFEKPGGSALGHFLKLEKLNKKIAQLFQASFLSHQTCNFFSRQWNEKLMISSVSYMRMGILAFKAVEKNRSKVH